MIKEKPDYDTEYYNKFPPEIWEEVDKHRRIQSFIDFLIWAIPILLILSMVAIYCFYGTQIINFLDGK